MELETYNSKKAFPLEIQTESKGSHQDLSNIKRPVELITSTEVFLGLQERWNELNHRSQKGTVFVSWEWLYTWWEIYHGDGNRQLYILVYKDSNNSIQGIAPFQIVSNAKYFPNFKQLVFLGTGETDGSEVFGEYADLILAENQENNITQAFSLFLFENKKHWDGIKFHQLLKDSHLSKLFSSIQSTQFTGIEKVVVEDGFRTYIELPATYSDYLMSLRKKMRNNITRTYKRLADEQNFQVEVTTEASELKAQQNGKPSVIDNLAMLNRERRGVMDKQSVFEQENFVKYHKKLIRRLLPLNMVRVRVLKIDEIPMAALYSYIDNGTLHAYQSGFDTEKGHRYSLLTTMLTQEIKNSIESPAIHRFNFMYSGDEQTYKRRYSGTTEKMYNIAYEKTGVRYDLYKFIQATIKPLVKKILKIE